MNLKVLHVLYQSLPDRAGSSIRSRDIVASQKSLGILPVVISSPFQKSTTPGVLEEKIEGISYYRTYSGNDDEVVSENDSRLMVKLRKFFRLFGFVKQLKNLVADQKPDVIHAHATFFCGLSAAYVGKKNGIPVVYEVRSLWEERQLKGKPSLKAKLQVALIRKLEYRAMRKAQLVIPINKNLKKNILERGIPEAKLSMIPNAVNLDRIPELKEKKGSIFTFAYIGSISPIEGLDDLCKQIARMNEEAYSCQLLIYGGGVAKTELEELTKQHQWLNIHFMGSINPSDVYLAYEKVDVIVNPRTPSKITHSVTPLKPLEAMGYQKLVLASDVGGMKELIEDQKTGFLFEASNNEDLYQKLCYIYNNWEKTQGFAHIKTQALDYVRKEKSWKANAASYLKLYQSLIIGKQ